MFLEDEDVYGSEICAVSNEVCYLIWEEGDWGFQKAATRFRQACPLFNSMEMKTGERPEWNFLRVVSSGHLFQKYGRMDHTEADRCDGQVQEESGST
ncbi:hypothetical protein CEXT_375491 [Caerostris extrusa]|uniref:Uncharacterized protein n=1 Tax=Caerostris extrusa TaxID=172846 RepID=A0AAV4NX89_CAEEX|nr:hypothetical protein CEXT_375491 [Caerostris extrusa]